METARLLTIAQTAELLNCSAGFVRKRIALTEAAGAVEAKVEEASACAV
jgi:hypothetical protein